MSRNFEFIDNKNEKGEVSLCCGLPMVYGTDKDFKFGKQCTECGNFIYITKASTKQEEELLNY